MEMARLSRQVGIQIALLINRGGAVEYVIAGDATRVEIPKLNRGRTHPGRLQGLRLIHTHLNNEGLSNEDLTDLAMLRLDLIYAITVSNTGNPLLAYGAHLVPRDSLSKVWQVLEPVPTYRITIPFDNFIKDLEEKITRSYSSQKVDIDKDRAILVAISSELSEEPEMKLAEFKNLAKSAKIRVLDTVIQKRPKPDPKFVVGKGKLSKIVIDALSMDANLLIFNHELSPSQARAVSDFTDLRVIDRTQLILDIFAQRAKTREGKIQVELAQLRYNMPRLVGANPALSRLAGGIGTRGPGETKLEIDRRRAKERISRLEHEISRISKKRKLTRQRRNKRSTPIISIIGYTNSGKSTLLNALTKSNVLVADIPFATLDPSSKRLRFPKNINVVITDTVGFLKELPNELKAAFMATLEELAEADLLLEVIDLTDPDIKDKIQAVEGILRDLHLGTKPRIKVFNKADKCDPSITEGLSKRYKGVVISAINKESLPPLIERMQGFFV
ncbi:MAG: GTPase HflX [Thermodesulfobacteriota bacterium]|nr:GTPase HflX [Thermodesulfobacteriota bacterium]